MKVIVEGDLKELLTTGRNRKYREIERNVLLMNSLKRVVQIMMAAMSTASCLKSSMTLSV